MDNSTPIFQPNFNPNDYIEPTTLDGEIVEHKSFPYGEKVMHNNLFNVDIFAQNEVEKTPLYSEGIFGRKHELNNWFGLKNKTTDQLLDCSPCSATYKLVNHADLFYKQASQIKESELPTDNITIVDYLYEKGRRAKREIYFNDLTTTIGSSNDRVKCRLDVFNSVDLSWQFQVFSGAYRNLCRNTLVFGGFKTYQQKARHTKNLDPIAMLGKATYSLENWNENKELMNTWRNCKITDQDYLNLVSNSTLGTVANTKSQIALGNSERIVNRSLLDYLFQVYKKETEGRGTLWSAYNSLTHWSTHTNESYRNDEGHLRHTGTKNAKTHVVQNKRNDLVRSLLNSDKWKALEMVA